jgi:hypothetical protein
MHNRRTILLLSLIGLLTLGGVLFWVSHAHRENRIARERLDQLLAQRPNELTDPMLRPQQPGFPETPDINAGPQPDPLNEAQRLFNGMQIPMPNTGVMVQETEDRYILRIPIAEAEDADSVVANVGPNHIEVSGQTGTKRNDTSITSSFMQSFNTTQEVMPDKVSRTLERKDNQMELVITIPKKHPGMAPSHPQTFSEEPDANAWSSPADDSNATPDNAPPKNDSPEFNPGPLDDPNHHQVF